MNILRNPNDLEFVQSSSQGCKHTILSGRVFSFSHRAPLQFFSQHHLLELNWTSFCLLQLKGIRIVWVAVQYCTDPHTDPPTLLVWFNRDSEIQLCFSNPQYRSFCHIARVIYQHLSCEDSLCFLTFSCYIIKSLLWFLQYEDFKVLNNVNEKYYSFS